MVLLFQTSTAVRMIKNSMKLFLVFFRWSHIVVRMVKKLRKPFRVFSQDGKIVGEYSVWINLGYSVSQSSINEEISVKLVTAQKNWEGELFLFPYLQDTIQTYVMLVFGSNARTSISSVLSSCRENASWKMPGQSLRTVAEISISRSRRRGREVLGISSFVVKNTPSTRRPPGSNRLT